MPGTGRGVNDGLYSVVVSLLQNSTGGSVVGNQDLSGECEYLCCVLGPYIDRVLPTPFVMGVSYSPEACVAVL